MDVITSDDEQVEIARRYCAAWEHANVPVDIRARVAEVDLVFNKALPIAASGLNATCEEATCAAWIAAALIRQTEGDIDRLKSLLQARRRH